MLTKSYVLTVNILLIYLFSSTLLVPKAVGAKPNIEGGSIEPTSDPIDLV